MKKINSTTFSKLAVGVMIAVGAVFVTGCAKDTKEDVALPGEGTRVVISVEGISEGNSGSFNKIQASAGKASGTQISNDKLIKGEAFDVFVTRPSSSVSQLGFKDKIRAAATSPAGLKAIGPMGNGNAYRVFLRKQGETTLESAAFTAGTTGAIAVEKGATYEWFALSYNSTTAVPEATGTDVVLSDINSLLYAKGEFSVAAEEGDVVVSLAILFKPRVTKAAIEINTMGMFASVAAAEINVTGLYSAPEAIDVVTGELVGGEMSKSIAFGDFIPIAESDGQRLIAEAYVAGNSSDSIKVNVSNLTITLDDGTVRDFGGATLTQGFLPEAGMTQNIVLNFIESPITTSRGGTTVNWARSNLYYETGFNAYRFFHTNPYTTTVEDQNKSFFSFRGHLPRQFASANDANQKDPCALVYPAGLWRTPSNTDINSLTSTNGLVGDLLGDLLSVVFAEPATSGATFGDNYIEYDVATPANPAYAGAGLNKLRFNYNGIQNDISAVSGLVTLSLGQVGDVASIWSSDRLLEVDLLNLGLVTTDVGAWGYLGATAPAGGLLPPRPERAIGSKGAGLLNLDVLNLGLLGSGFQNVRCVRDASWNPEATGYNPYPDLTSL